MQMQIDQPPPPPSIEMAAEPSQLAGEQAAGAPIVDMRREFERITAGTPRDLAAERAFIDCKIDIIRNDPTMSEAEKAAAIEELARRR
jgi:hypothetical protein